MYVVRIALFELVVKVLSVILIKTGLKAVYELFTDRNKRPFSMDYRERGYHARGVYPTQGTSRSKGGARGRSRHKSNGKRVVRNVEENNLARRGKALNNTQLVLRT